MYQMILENCSDNKSSHNFCNLENSTFVCQLDYCFCYETVLLSMCIKRMMRLIDKNYLFKINESSIREIRLDLRKSSMKYIV